MTKSTKRETKTKMEKIYVAVRVRPSLSQGRTFWNVEDNRVSPLMQPGTPISFSFDHVFDQNCRNARVYELLTKKVIHAALNGFNGTVFAYGQTGSGKTFTMNGSSSEPGIIPLAVRDIFDNLHMMFDREFLIRVSYMEIYNEEINDLLVVGNKKLAIHESSERGIFVAGLREEIVNSAEQVIKLIESGEVNRHFGKTNMNIRISTSHTIFRMVIESKGKETNSSGDYSGSDTVRVSVLNLVDLAGSERIAKTGAGGVRSKEGKHINKSLMALGNVINKLSERAKQRRHIPYRDSKLTRIHQPALGGNAKTSIICTIAPEEVHIEETKGTLQFASRAKRITNCAQVNEEQDSRRQGPKEQCDDSNSACQANVFRSGGSNENYRQEVLKLKRRLELVTEEKDKFQRKYAHQVLMNDKLIGEISDLKKEALLIQEIPQRLCESLASCKDFYEDVLFTMQSFASDGNSSTAKLLSSSSEIGSSLFSSLETLFSMAMDGNKSFAGNDSLFQEHCNILCERLKNIIITLALSETPAIDNE